MPFKVAFGDIKPVGAGEVCGGKACALSVIPGEDPESIGRWVRWRFWRMQHQGLDSRLRGNDGGGRGGGNGAARCTGPSCGVVPRGLGRFGGGVCGRMQETLHNAQFTR